MAYAPIALTLPQYEDYANWYLKAYTQGTTTPLSMATDSGGGTTLAKSEIDANGFPTTDGSARFTPYINGAYDLWMFPTSAEADANDTTNAIQLADNINADPASAITVTTVSYTDNVSALIAVDGTVESRVHVSGYRTTGDGAGGIYFWDASQDKANHNGITIIDPDRPWPSDWGNATQVTAWFTAGTGTGCWIKTNDNVSTDTRYQHTILAGVLRQDMSDVIGSLDAGSNTTTLIKTGGFVNASVGDRIYNVTRDLASFITVKTSNDQVTISPPITGQTDGDTVYIQFLWYALDDSTHAPVGISSVSGTTGDIVITYDQTFTKVNSLVAVPDETFSSLGIRCGASVNLSNASIRLSKDLNFYIGLASGSVVVPSYFTGSVSASVSGGTVTVTHGGSVENDDYPQLTISEVSPGSTINDQRYRYKLYVDSTTQFRIVTLCPFEGYISYDGANWQVSTEAATSPTMAWSTDHLVVTHETFSGTQYPQLVARNGPYDVKGGTVTATTFDIYFYDASGTLITTPDTSMRVFYSGAEYVEASASAGYAYVHVPNVVLDANMVNSNGGNIWVYGIMQK